MHKMQMGGRCGGMKIGKSMSRLGGIGNPPAEGVGRYVFEICSSSQENDRDLFIHSNTSWDRTRDQAQWCVKNLWI